MLCSPTSRPVRALVGTTVAGALVGTGTLCYALLEAKSYRLRHVNVPILPVGVEPLKILHLSDLHLRPSQREKRDWITGLSTLKPDLVVATGDFMAHPNAVGSIVTALGPLLDVPGLFVFGSNDYFAPRMGNPLKYFSGPSEYQLGKPDLPWEDLAGALSGCGWLDLSNRRDSVNVAGQLLDVRGVDDPHIGRDDYPLVAGPFDPTADLALGVTHAPYLRVIDEMAADGADLILAGHTHGGQVCIPGYGALVTNCDLDPKRAKGLSKHHDSYLHVSAGLGTSPFAPVRFACPPEASLLTLVPQAPGRQRPGR